MKIVLIVGIDKHYLLQRYPASLGDCSADSYESSVKR